VIGTGDCRKKAQKAQKSDPPDIVSVLFALFCGYSTADPRNERVFGIRSSETMVAKINSVCVLLPNETM
jgi:hypothetical protein